MNPNPPVRDSASYYRGLFPLTASFLLSPGLLLFFDVTPRIGYLSFSVFGISLLIALLLPRNKELLQRVGKAVLASLVLGAIIYGGIYLIVSELQDREMAQLGNRWWDFFRAMSISLKYMELLGKLCRLVPWASFVVLWSLRRYWNLSAALLLAVSNLPLILAVLIFF